MKIYENTPETALTLIRDVQRALQRVRNLEYNEESAIGNGYLCGACGHPTVSSNSHGRNHTCWMDNLVRQVEGWIDQLDMFGRMYNPEHKSFYKTATFGGDYE